MKNSDHKFDVAVVGLGYVGLPVVIGASQANLRVLGFDVNSETVENLRKGKSHIEDISDKEILKSLKSGTEFTVDPDFFDRCNAFIICVPTPLSDSGEPDLSAIESAARVIAPYVKKGNTVILESTSFPGTTEEVLAPIIESAGNLKAGRDFHLGFSPERIDPNNREFNLRNTPKVVSGLTKECLESVSAIYSLFCEQVVETQGIKEAELSKLLENTFRHLNIALVNELAMVCNSLGIDVWETIRLSSTKPFGFMPFWPGPGVGGHCIPIDPNYLSFKVKRDLGYPFKLIEMAHEINEGMPIYVVERIIEMLLDRDQLPSHSKVLVLGVTYKPNISDTRETPATELIRQLRERKVRVAFHDPNVDEFHVDGNVIEAERSLDRLSQNYDLAVILQHHANMLIAPILESGMQVLDTRGSITHENVTKL